MRSSIHRNLGLMIILAVLLSLNGQPTTAVRAAPKNSLRRQAVAGGSRQARPALDPATHEPNFPLTDKVTTLAAGYSHTCALISSGGVMCWGWNGYGQLGDGTIVDRSVPTPVINLDRGMTALVAGGYHTCAVAASGEMMCWGANWYGQLGDGTITQRSEPMLVSGLEGEVTSMAAGWYHTCALMASDRVYCWGGNGYGQLGDGTTTQSSVPSLVNGLGGGVITLAAGLSHTCALIASGEVMCWGGNYYGQLGDGTITDRRVPTPVSDLASGVIALAAGEWHTCALTISGEVMCWGWNDYGQLGDGTTTQRNSPTLVSGLSSEAIALVAGRNHTCALMTFGEVMCWGSNGDGQLGDGTTTDRIVPTPVSELVNGVIVLAAGYSHTCVLTAGGGVKCWGWNGSGQLGDGTITQRNTPTPVSSLTGKVAVLAAGMWHTCALATGGEVVCWGYNGYGQLGDGTTIWRSVPTPISETGDGIIALAAGELHTCGLTGLGGMMCWGGNGYGQLGDGSTIQRLVPTPVIGLMGGVTILAVGGYHTCALPVSGGVLCWGLNGDGQLGDNTITDRSMPISVVGLGSEVTDLATGKYHTCALTASGGVWCWGGNGYGQLGDGTILDRSVPTPVSGLGSGVTSLAAGGYHTCALTASGGVMCWGWNISGQLGNGTTTDHIVPTPVSGLSSGVTALTAGGGHTCILTMSGMVMCWGNNEFGQIGDGTTGQRLVPTLVSSLGSEAIALAAGGWHTCALMASEGVMCWGWDWFGQLGLGMMTQRLTPVNVVGFAEYSSFVNLPIIIR